jgi:hypothetical protein
LLPRDSYRPVLNVTVTLAAALLHTGCFGAWPKHATAEVLAIVQEQTENPAPGLSSISSVSEAQLGEHEPFRVPAEKRAAVSFVPGIAAVVHTNAEIACERLVVVKDGNETSSDAMKLRDVKVRLDRGAASFWIASETGASTTLQIAASGMNLEAGVGTLFYVDAQQQAVFITCVRGQVRVTAGGHDLKLRSGQSWTSSQDGAADLPQPAAANPRAQEALETAAVDERLLTQLLTAKGAAPPRWRHMQ